MNKKAFSLIELLMVIVILSIISGIGYFSVVKYRENTKMHMLFSMATSLKSDIINRIIEERPINDDFNVMIIPEDVIYKNIDFKNQDPWNHPYDLVYASASRINNNLTLQIFFEISGKGCYALYEGNTSMYRTGSTCNPI